LWRTCIGARDDTAHDTGLPAEPGFNEKVVFLGPVAAHFAERHAETIGANPRRFRQNCQQIVLAKRKTAKSGYRCLLTKQHMDLGCVLIHELLAPGRR